MNWKVGDTAVAIYDIYKSAKQQNSTKHFKTISKGTKLKVQAVFRSGCSILLDVGLKEPLSIKEAYCICCKCNPSHEIPAQLNRGKQLFLISRWFIKDNGNPGALERALEENQKNPLKKKHLFLRDPLLVPKKEQEKILL